jgi:hypothetical protein
MEAFLSPLACITLGIQLQYLNTDSHATESKVTKHPTTAHARMHLKSSSLKSHKSLSSCTALNILKFAKLGLSKVPPRTVLKVPYAGPSIGLPYAAPSIGLP